MIASRRIRAAAVLALACAPLNLEAGIVLENMVEVCADPDRPPREALKFCLNALERSDMDREPPEIRAKVLMNAGIAAHELGRDGQAIEAHSRALRIHPQLAGAYLGRARAYARTGRLEQAMADYDAALRLAPRDPQAWLGRGTARLKAGDAAGAISDFDRALRLRRDLPAAHFNRGLAHAMAGQHARAEADFSAVLAQNPQDAEAWVNRGKARLALGRPGAGADFDRALELRPDWAAGWFARGRYHDAIGRREAADADYMRAYQLGHSDPRLIERVQRIGGG